MRSGESLKCMSRITAVTYKKTNFNTLVNVGGAETGGFGRDAAITYFPAMITIERRVKQQIFKSLKCAPETCLYILR